MAQRGANLNSSNFQWLIFLILSLHRDWLDNYGDSLMKEYSFSYENVNFEEIANASRN